MLKLITMVIIIIKFCFIQIVVTAYGIQFYTGRFGSMGALLSGVSI